MPLLHQWLSRAEQPQPEWRAEYDESHGNSRDSQQQHRSLVHRKLRQSMVDLRDLTVALTRDLSLFGMVRQPRELRSQIEALTPVEVNEFLERWDPGQPSLTTLGLPAVTEAPTQATSAQATSAQEARA